MSMATNRPIRPTQIKFNSAKDMREFEEYAFKSEKTTSVGMEKMREMMKEFKQKRG